MGSRGRQVGSREGRVLGRRIAAEIRGRGDAEADLVGSTGTHTEEEDEGEVREEEELEVRDEGTDPPRDQRRRHFT
jgi:hypothetical protein